jgi:hypothetical protein
MQINIEKIQRFMYSVRPLSICKAQMNKIFSDFLTQFTPAQRKQINPEIQTAVESDPENCYAIYQIDSDRLANDKPIQACVTFCEINRVFKKGRDVVIMEFRSEQFGLFVLA